MPFDKMMSSAQQLGEFCLTVDLSYVLNEKRKKQLDQMAKLPNEKGKNW